MSRKRGPQRTPAQRDRDRARVAELYLRGTPLPQITKIVNSEAETYEITYQAIWLDLRWCRAQWQKEAKRSIDQWVGEQLKKIDVLEAEYWNAWIKSQQEKKSSSVRSKGSRRKRKDSNGIEEEEIIPLALEKWEKREERLGDPRYLDGFYNCIMARLKILGREGPDPEDKIKEAAERIRETIADIDSLMDLEPDEEEAELEEAGANKNGS